VHLLCCVPMVMKDLGFFLRSRLLPKLVAPRAEVIDLCGDTQDAVVSEPGGASVGPLAGATVQSRGRNVDAPPQPVVVLEPMSSESGGKAEPPLAGSVQTTSQSTRRKKQDMPNPRGASGAWLKRLRGPQDLWGPSLFDSGFGYQHRGGGTGGASSSSDDRGGSVLAVAQPGLADAATTTATDKEGDHGKVTDSCRIDWDDSFFAGGPGTLSYDTYKLNEY
jgi:hypothetical protein